MKNIFKDLFKSKAECPKCHSKFVMRERHTNVKLDKHYRYICDKCWKEHKKLKMIC